MPTAVINASVLGNNTIVAAPPTGYCIRVLYFLLSTVGTAATNAQFVSGASTALTGLIYFPATAASIDAGEVAPAARGLFQTLNGQALNLALSAAQAYGGFVVYEQVAQ